MDRQLAERMVGAAVLLTVLVVVVPLILDGGDDEAREPTSPEAAPLDLRTHTIHLDREARELPVPRPVAPPDASVAGSSVGDSPSDAAAPDSPSTDPSAARSPDSDASPGTEADARAVVSADSPERAGPDPAAAPDAPPPQVEAPRTAARAPSPPAPAPAAAPVPSPSPAPAPKPSVTATATDEGWVVQLGSFSQRPNAERLASEARAKGFQVSVLSTSVGGGTHHRVRTGVIAERDAAQTLAGRMASAGYPNQVMRP